MIRKYRETSLVGTTAPVERETVLADSAETDDELCM